MAMYNPAHPGEVIREDILKPLGLSVSETARRLGVNRKTLFRVLNGRGPVTPEIALRLEMAFKPSAESWLREQAAYDLWQVRQHAADIHITPIEVHAPESSGI